MLSKMIKLLVCKKEFFRIFEVSCITYIADLKLKRETLSCIVAVTEIEVTLGLLCLIKKTRRK